MSVTRAACAAACPRSRRGLWDSSRSQFLPHTNEAASLQHSADLAFLCFCSTLMCGATVQVDSQGSSLGWSCTRPVCSVVPISIVTQAGRDLNGCGGLHMLRLSADQHSL